jgi:toxin YoeB
MIDMGYSIRYGEKFLKDKEAHQKAGRKSILIKLNTLINDIREHPRTGIGLPEQLGYDRKGQWSRRITEKHRLVYEIHDNIVTVVMISAMGHYGDK